MLAPAWRHEIFLVVIAMPVAAITLAVHERLADRSDARRAAALALTAPTGATDAAALERIVAADLAAASLADAAVIDGAVTLAEHTIEDPWRRSLACERLLTAKQMIWDTGLPAEPRAATRLRAPPARRTSRLDREIAACAAAAAVLTAMREVAL